MVWLKRNLLLVGSAVVGLLVLGYGGYLLWTAIEADSAAENDLKQTKSELDTVLKSQPFPNAANLAAAKDQVDRAQKFVAEAAKFFPAIPPTVGLTSESFNSMLENTRAELLRAMGRLGPSNYNFSFQGLISRTSFDPASLRPLADQVAEVKMICEILFASGISELREIRRVRVAPDEPANSSELLPAPFAAVRNDETGMEIWPYEVQFTCFSSALGAVLEALAKSPHALVVKSVRVEPGSLFAEGPVRQPVQPKRTNAPTAMITLLQEHRLYVTLIIESIKPAHEGNRPRSGPPGNRPMGAGPLGVGPVSPAPMR